MSKIDALGIDSFVSTLEISLSIQEEEAVDKLKDSLVLRSSGLSSKMFRLEIPERNESFPASDFNMKYLDLKIYTADMSLNHPILKKLKMEISCQNPGQKRIQVMKNVSVSDMIKEKKARIGEDHVNIQIKRLNNIVGKISVFLLGSHIVNSPVSLQFFHDEKQDPCAHNLTLANDSRLCEVDSLIFNDTTSNNGEEGTVEELFSVWEQVSDDDSDDDSSAISETTPCSLLPETCLN